MSEQPAELRDEEMAMRLKAEMGPMPARLTMRLEHLAVAGLRDAHPRVTPLWREVAPQVLGAALMLALFVGALLRLQALAAAGVPLSPPVSHASPGALRALMLPLAALVWMEALRGAPTVQRWLHGRG